jgi:predicted ATPase
MAPVAQIVKDGLSFSAPVTFLVGENGSGKSMITEAAAALGRTRSRPTTRR